jgi:protein-tyrosine phosphatase
VHDGSESASPPQPAPTLQQLRHLPLAGTLNVRDVGGYPADGGTTRWGTLLRGDSIHNLDDAGRAHFARLGLRTVVDLRRPNEREKWPDALDGLGVRFHLQPLDAEDLEAVLRRPPLETYKLSVDQRGEQLAGAVAALAQPGAFPALVHCMAGKDRTGVVIAFTLAAVGVPDDVVAADYQLSRQYFTGPLVAQIRQRMIDDDGMTADLADAILDAPAELILATLDHVRARHGSVPAYLARHGVDDGTLAALHAALVAPPG